MKSFVVFGVALLSCSVANALTGQSCNGNEFTSDPSNCGIYYQCVNGGWVRQTCPAGLNFNKIAKYCDWPANAPCDDSQGPSPTTTTTKAPQPQPTTTTTAAPKPPTTTTTKAPSPGGPALISKAEFVSAAQTKGGNPDDSYYQGFIKSLEKAGITTRREAILFLAHAVWETVGFIYTKEVYCQTNLQDCANAYPNYQGGLPGKVYYGRGMMQLTWDYNYKAASAYLYGDDRLLQNPDIVGEDPEVGWATAAYYWWANVHTRSDTFGSTLKAINGFLECEGGSHGQNRYLRFMHYKDILTRLGEQHPPDSDGWCTAY